MTPCHFWPHEVDSKTGLVLKKLKNILKNGLYGNFLGWVRLFQRKKRKYGDHDSFGFWGFNTVILQYFSINWCQSIKLENFSIWKIFFDSETTFVLIRGWHLRLKSLITFYNHMSSSRAIIMVLTGRLFVKISKSAKLLCKNPQKT